MSYKNRDNVIMEIVQQDADVTFFITNPPKEALTEMLVLFCE